jgi:hypothetical protein
VGNRSRSRRYWLGAYFYRLFNSSVILILKNGVKIRYYYRVIKPDFHSRLIAVTDGEELLFGRGVLSQPEYLPNPHYCNIKLAVGRILHACGAAEIIDYLFHLYEDSHREGAMTFLDGSPAMLDLLDATLHQIAV